MKKFLVIIMVFIAMPTFADDYFCNYYDNGTYYSSSYTPGKTVEQFCKNWCDSDFWINNGKCDECKNKDYPRLSNAYNSGSCKKIMSPIIYNNVEGCECKVMKLEDGTIYGTSCYGTSNSNGCNTNKAMAKMKWMLTE